jgi:hypothetical protein
MHLIFLAQAEEAAINLDQNQSALNLELLAAGAFNLIRFAPPLLLMLLRAKERKRRSRRQKLFRPTWCKPQKQSSGRNFRQV